MKISGSVILTVILALLIAGCEKEIPWDLQPSPGRFLVVDALLTNEAMTQKITLTLTNTSLNAPAEYVSGARVRVTSNAETWVFTEDSANPGVYLSPAFRALVRRDYILEIDVGDSHYQASARAEGVSRLGKFQVALDPESQLYRYVPNEYVNPAMTEIFYSWAQVPRYCEEYGSCKAKEFFYQLDNIDVNEEFGPEKEVIYFPPGTWVRRRNYSLTDSHQQFLRSLLMETEWRGGLFDVQQGNVPTNLSEGALGYFAVCMVDVDSVLVQ